MIALVDAFFLIRAIGKATVVKAESRHQYHVITLGYMVAWPKESSGGHARSRCAAPGIDLPMECDMVARKTSGTRETSAGFATDRGRIDTTVANEKGHRGDPLSWPCQWRRRLAGGVAASVPSEPARR